MVVSWISAWRGKGVSLFPITKGARVIDSTPPAMQMSASPVRIARAAAATASRPEAQSRLRVKAGVVSGRSAISVAMRATLRLSSPAWLAQPSSTSSTCSRIAGWRLASARIGIAARSSARTAASAPP
jgi:hypothetical protein